jgi:opacity protein-like surface antigen
VKKFAFFVFLITQLCILGVAQNSGSNNSGSASEQNAWGEAYLGYAHVTGDIGQNGWEVAGAKNFSKRFAAEADFTGSYGNTSILTTSFKQHQYSFLFGPKVMFSLKNSDKFTPFAHLLFGVGHMGLLSDVPGVTNGDTSFAWALGGGVDYNLNDRWAARGKLDVYHTDYFGSGDAHARWGFGIVYKFGHGLW